LDAHNPGTSSNSMDDTEEPFSVNEIQETINIGQEIFNGVGIRGSIEKKNTTNAMTKLKQSC